ncbi:lysylphosphatidylglycerol synthase transmembrane domain-containing protein [Candidatus Vampirococcus lugosii]|uniref:Lysylphosphatidylglycerol synthetase/glycosyltransferase (AglD) n=1 Tax=Candidatus Vampirococcus lugosii TaxID=2789015 RepID=A0ABS5QPB4_9BACT|nr:lysylphosphatidylglycerol synthase transmembrane domain-containing protein [Candidatus Vampirococcus lugosii]MBS8122406.1 Lysylphosphatidylglycerol synthetase/glycosyltransferase (AglD) [Candidatus Vampirococcus lugosii]
MNKIKFLIKLSITIFLFYIIFAYYIDFDEFIKVFQNINIFYVIIACLLWPVGIFLSSFKWYLILKQYDINISLKESFNLYWIASFFNNFLPSSIGGDGYKFLYLNKKIENKKAQIMSSMILERGLGFVALNIFIIIFSISFLPILYTNNIIIFYIIIFLIISILGFFIFLLLNKKSIKNEFKNKLLNKFVKLINILITFKNKKVLFFGFLISFIFVLNSIIGQYLLFGSLGNNVDLSLISFVYPIVNIVGIIPISINSLGVTESFSIYMYGIFGVNAEIVLASAILGRVLMILLSATGGIRYLFWK